MSTNNHNQTEKDWMDRFDRIQNTQSEQITQLSENVSALTADVRTLMKNQESLFSQTSKPFQWGSLIAAISLGVLAITLVITPMKEQDAEHEEFNKIVLQHMMDSQFINGQRESDREWMMKLEERTFGKLHRNPNE